MSGVAHLTEVSLARPTKLMRDQVAEYLRDAIFELSLTPGTPLIERQICEATGASRPTVREAIRQLEYEGLVRSEHGRGTIVVGLTNTEAQQIYEIRAQLEALACQLFIERATQQQHEKLSEALNALDEYTDEPAAFLRETANFYDVLFEGAGNLELQRILQGFRQRITLARSTSLAVPGRPGESLAEVRKMVEAVNARDTESAVQASIAHVQAAARVVKLHRHDD